MMHIPPFFFETPKGDLYIYDVIDGQVEYLDALLQLYREFFPQYLSALPDIRERAFLPAKVDPRFVRHQWVLVLNGFPVGFVSFRYAIQHGLGLCLSIAIRPDYRALAWGHYRRLSEFVFQQMLWQMEQDAAKSERIAPLGLVVEVEMETSNKPYLHLCARYEEYGFLPLPIAYNEPAFVRGAPDAVSAGAYPMKLYMLPICTDFQVYLPQNSLLNKVIDVLLVDHYGLSEDHWIVKQARESIETLGEHHDDRKS